MPSCPFPQRLLACLAPRAATDAHLLSPGQRVTTSTFHNKWGVACRKLVDNARHMWQHSKRWQLLGAAQLTAAWLEHAAPNAAPGSAPPALQPPLLEPPLSSVAVPPYTSFKPPVEEKARRQTEAGTEGDRSRHRVAQSAVTGLRQAGRHCVPDRLLTGRRRRQALLRQHVAGGGGHLLDVLQDQRGGAGRDVGQCGALGRRSAAASGCSWRVGRSGGGKAAVPQLAASSVTARRVKQEASGSLGRSSCAASPTGRLPAATLPNACPLQLLTSMGPVWPGSTVCWLSPSRRPSPGTPAAGAIVGSDMVGGSILV